MLTFRHLWTSSHWWTVNGIRSVYASMVLCLLAKLHENNFCSKFIYSFATRSALSICCCGRSMIWNVSTHATTKIKWNKSNSFVLKMKTKDKQIKFENRKLNQKMMRITKTTAFVKFFCTYKISILLSMCSNIKRLKKKTYQKVE